MTKTILGKADPNHLIPVSKLWPFGWSKRTRSSYLGYLLAVGKTTATAEFRVPYIYKYLGNPRIKVNFPYYQPKYNSGISQSTIVASLLCPLRLISFSLIGESDRLIGSLLQSIRNTLHDGNLVIYCITARSAWSGSLRFQTIDSKALTYKPTLSTVVSSPGPLVQAPFPRWGLYPVASSLSVVGLFLSLSPMSSSPPTLGTEIQTTHQVYVYTPRL